MRLRVSLAFLLAVLPACSSRQAGLRATSSGDWTGAVHHLKDAVRADSKDALALRELGLAYLKLGDAALAEGALDEASKLDPEDRIAWRTLALTREKLGWQTRALETWQALIQAHPGDRLTPAFRDHLTRRSAQLSGLSRQAGEDRVETLREKGLLDDNNLPRSIVVLPFEGPPEFPRHRRMARALARMIAHDLSRLDIIWVMGPEEALRGMRLRGLEFDPSDVSRSMARIGKAFGAGMVIGGKLQKGFDDDIRADVILAQPEPFASLLDTRTQGTGAKLVALEREILDKLVSTLGILPSEQERARFGRFHTESTKALGLYLDGIAGMHQGDYASALPLLLESVEHDADFPCPHRALSLIYRFQNQTERARNALRLGQGNPLCVADDQLLALRVDMDARVARVLHSDLIQGRTAMRNGVQYLFAGDTEMNTRALRTGFSGSATVQADVTPSGWIWGADGSGIPGIADPSTRGGLPGSGLSPPDTATSGAGGAGRD